MGSEQGVHRLVRGRQGGRGRRDVQPVRGATTPPKALVAAWQAFRPDLIAPGAQWGALSGGQTNAVWKVRGPGPDGIVIKLFSPQGETPLFANDPDAEVAALTALAGTNLAPGLVASLLTPAGRSLAYTFVPGQSWRAQDNPGDVAHALARLHARPVPKTLRASDVGPERLVDAARAMTSPGQATLPIPVQEPATAAPPRRFFLHGDPTASNTLVTPSGITFVDWQCPSVGDPADDLAIFLSPAMQIVSGNSPLPRHKEAVFLAAYAQTAPDGAATVARYRALAPLYHARMAAYAAWRTARGEPAYAHAADVERARITEAE